MFWEDVSILRCLRRGRLATSPIEGDWTWARAPFSRRQTAIQQGLCALHFSIVHPSSVITTCYAKGVIIWEVFGSDGPARGLFAAARALVAAVQLCRLLPTPSEFLSSLPSYHGRTFVPHILCPLPFKRAGASFLRRRRVFDWAKSYVWTMGKVKINLPQ